MKVRFNTPPTDAAESNGLPLRYAAARRKVPRLRWYLLLALVTAPLLYFSGNIFLAAIWDSSPGFVVLNEVVVRAEAPGIVHTTMREGAAVQPALPLGTLQVQAAATGLTAPDTRGADLTALALARRAHAQALSAAHARVKQAQGLLPLVRQQVAVAARRLADLDRLLVQGAATAAERGQAQGQWAAAEADRLRAEAELENARQALQTLAADAPVQSDGAAAGNALSATSGHAALQRNVVAPSPGNQLHWLVRDGEWVAQGTDLAIVYLPDAPLVRVYISPSDMLDAQVGVRTELLFMDGVRLPATVVRVGVEASRIPPERVGPLATRMQSIVAELKPDAPLPMHYRINSLPLDVRFSRFSRWIR